MGECGCSTDKVGRFSGQDKVWYVLEVYPGCTYCGLEWGLGVSRVEEDSDMWEFLDCSCVPIIEFGSLDEWGTTILDTQFLLKAFVEEQEDQDELSETNFAFSEFVNRGGLKRTYYDTRNKYEV